MKITRKGFLAGLTALTAVAASRKLLGEKKPEMQAAPPAYEPREHKFSYGIDIDRCIGCGKCVEACKEENGVPLDAQVSRTWIERYQITAAGEVLVDSPDQGRKGFPESDRKDIVDTFFVPKMCNLCERSACTQVCPVGATFDSPDGPILVDPSYCIGCGYCVQACPYGTRFMSPVTHTADKCNLCYHRVTRGLKPACVEVCPTEARVFGDLTVPGNPMAKFTKKNRLNVLKPHLGTKPQVVYANFRREIN